MKIVKQSKSIFSNKKIQLLAGGFHLRDHSEQEIKQISDELKSLGVKNVAPSHCSGSSAMKIFKEEWKDNYIELNLGDELRF